MLIRSNAFVVVFAVATVFFGSGNLATTAVPQSMFNRLPLEHQSDSHVLWLAAASLNSRYKKALKYTRKLCLQVLALRAQIAVSKPPWRVVLKGRKAVKKFNRQKKVAVSASKEAYKACKSYASVLKKSYRNRIISSSERRKLKKAEAFLTRTVKWLVKATMRAAIRKGIEAAMKATISARPWTE